MIKLLSKGLMSRQGFLLTNLQTEHEILYETESNESSDNPGKFETLIDWKPQSKLDQMSLEIFPNIHPLKEELTNLNEFSEGQQKYVDETAHSVNSLLVKTNKIQNLTLIREVGEINSLPIQRKLDIPANI